MASTDYIYRRTVAGHSAVESDAPIAPPLRRVLGLIDAETHSHVLRRLLRQYTDTMVADWLAQLERLGLVETLPTQVEHDLDFTGSFGFHKTLNKG